MLSGVAVTVEQLLGLRFPAGRLDLGGRRWPRSALTGGRVSRFRGRGMDFDESRLYLPGDDIRTIDWRVTARTGVAHTKVYREERERPVFLVVDFSPTMFFGTRVAFKSVVAAEAAAMLAWAAAAGGDRIGALVFGGGAHRELRPAGGRRGVLGVLTVLAGHAAARAPAEAGDRDLAHALLRTRRVARPGSLIFVISDFYALSDDAERHLTRLRLHNDVAACWVFDRLEVQAPPPGRYAVSDGRARAVIETGAGRVRRAYGAPFARRRRRLEAITRDAGVTLVALETGADVGETLRRGLAAQTARPPSGHDGGV